MVSPETDDEWMNVNLLRILTWAPIGLLIVNSVPHLMAGRAGIVFKTPFARYSSARANLRWGLANIVVGVALLVLHLVIRPAGTAQLVAVTIGAIVAVANFFFRAKSFQDDRTALEPVSRS